MPTSYQEVADVTSVLKNILDNYPAGGAILRELLQNSDDAGAESQTFRLDCRSYPVAGLQNHALERCQGPSLLAMNNSTFRDEDWRALARINDSSKSADETTTGKYGLGFRSCYHVTDNPQIYSKSSLRILDAHREFPGAFAGGMNLDSSGRDLTDFPSLFQPFASLSSPTTPLEVVGTVIRLPLRSAEQAKRSRIKSGPDAQVSLATVRDWFDHFITNELPVVMLFLKHIISIKMEVVSDDGTILTVAEACILNAKVGGIVEKRCRNRGRDSESSHYILNIETRSEGKPINTRKWMVAQYVANFDEIQKNLTNVLGWQWQIDDVANQMVKDKLLPHVALALPLPSANVTRSAPVPFEGRLFSLLPLPIVTNFPLHIHAIFALLSSRQHLRNPQEDVGSASRERLLIEWNRLTFNVVIPRAWTYLIRNLQLVNSQLSIYSAWPDVGLAGSKQGDSTYWADLSSNLLQEVSSLPVWPDLSGRLCFLEDVLVASNESEELVRVLGSAGVPIIRPPQHIVDLIASSPFSTRILSPQTACSALEARIIVFERLDGQKVDIISDYMASAKDITLFARLPLLPSASGNFICLASSGAIIATSLEIALFGDMEPAMLALEKMPEATKHLMATSTSVHRLGASNLFPHLQKYQPANPTPPSGTIHWLCQFWEYMSGWDGCSALMDKIKDYHIIPTLQGSLRRLSAQILDPADIQESTLLQAFTDLAIPLLHSDVRKKARTLLRNHKLISLNDPGFLLDEISMNKPHQSLFALSPRCSLALHNHFKHHLHSTRLNNSQISTLLHLPVFPILRPGNRNQRGDPLINLGPAKESSYFVDNSVSVVPRLIDATFINGDACREIVSALQLTDDIKDELGILELVLDHSDQWFNQSNDVVKRLLERFFNRLSDLPDASCQQLRELSFIDVGHGMRSPSEVVDPSCRIADLFDVNDRVLPAKGRGKNEILQKLQHHKFLQTELTSAIIEERIENMDKSRLLTLLQVIDDHFLANKDIPKSFLPPSFFSTAWIPASDSYYAISNCRDKRPVDTLLLYDLAVPVVRYTVKSRALSEQMGWNDIPLDLIVEQMKKAVEVDGSKDKSMHRRICTLIKELALRLYNKSCSIADLGALQMFLTDHRWVPISDTDVEFASLCMIELVDFGEHSTFKQVQSALKRDKKVVALLEYFGVHKRPTVGALLSELDRLQHLEHQAPSLVKTAVAILTEIADRGALTSEQRKTICVPTTQRKAGSVQFRILDEVYYNDLPHDRSSKPASLPIVHPSISLELANKLEIQRRSDLAFEEVEDDPFDTFNVGEDFTTRIQNVLKAYEGDASSNEWVANAADAGASDVSIICNDHRNKIKHAPSPTLKRYLEGPSLLVYNSATFSEDDFNGLRNTGVGGKVAKPDSIGRFGLGVLSFYHFGDIIILVSGSSVVFLDPSGESLPRESRSRGGGRRTGLKLTLEVCQMRYPDILSILKGVEGFDASKDHFDGTIFLVPLRTDETKLFSKISQVSVSAQTLIRKMEGAFFLNAERSLFFTKISSIRASYRTSPDAVEPIWSVSASREHVNEAEVMSHQHLDLKVEGPQGRLQTSKWLIVWHKAVLPSHFGDLASTHRLSSVVSSAVAVQLSPKRDPTALQMLFATLPLPLTTKFCLHIHSQWILSDSRRHLHLDSSNQHHPGMDTSFNRWLLSSVIPPLLLHTIATLHTDDRASVLDFPWPTQGCFDNSVDQLIAEGFFSMLPNSIEPVFRVPSGLTICPSDAILGFSHRPSVQKLLEQLTPDNFVIPPFISSRLTTTGPIKIDSPSFVRSIVSTHASEILTSDILDEMDVDELVGYLIEGEQSLIGLPLLCLQDREFVRFASPRDPPVFEFNEAIMSLFGERHVVVSEGKGKLKAKTRNAIIKAGDVNLRELDAKGLRSLLACSRFRITPRPSWVPKDFAEALAWITGFWKVLVAGGFKEAVQLTDLGDLPLLPTVNRKMISLSTCSDQPVLWKIAEHPTETDQVLDTLAGLGVLVVEISSSTLALIRSSEYKPSIKVNIDLVIDCLSTIGATSGQISRVSPESWSRLASWITSQIERQSPQEFQNFKTTYPIIHSLPLWSAQQVTSVGPSQLTLRPLKDISLLPPNVSLDDIAGFMSSGNTWFARASATLTTILHPNRSISGQNLIQQLSLPRSIKQEEIPPYTSLLNVLQRLGTRLSTRLFVPNGLLQLADPNTLYDRDVPLYAFAFQYEPARFVKEEFLNMMWWFQNEGVETTVTADGFKVAASAIDRFIRSGREPAIGAGLEIALEELNRRPWMFQPNSRKDDYERIRGLRIIPRQELRRSIPAFEAFAAPLPSVVSLDQVVREEDHLVAWTQRGRTRVEPDPDLISVFPDIGVPTTLEVVTHLSTLAHIMQSYPGDASPLVEDIIATYQWLDKYSEDASQALSARCDEPIFMNVDSASDDIKTWHSASTMWLNLEWDDPAKSVFSVKSFLESFPNLLKAAGVRKYPRATYSGPTSSGATLFKTVHSNLHNFRLEDRWTDVALQPRNGEAIKAHRILMAASSTYFHQLFTGPFREGNIPVSSDAPIAIAVPEYSHEEVESCIRFMYNGVLVAPHTPIENSSDANNALASLVNLLDLSNKWGVEDLKTEVGRSIIDLNLIGPSTVETLIERCEAAEAQDLLADCLKIRDAARAEGWDQEEEL